MDQQRSDSATASGEAGPVLSGKAWSTPLILAAVAGLIYFFSNPHPGAHFDYTFRTAIALLHGHLGFAEQPPAWLNEMVPVDGRFYSVFPLGAVLSVLPFALLKVAHVIDVFPAAFAAALIAASSAAFFFLISANYDLSFAKRIMLALFPVFGTWMWANLAFAGAWQISLGFAVLGQVGALYFILVRPNPRLAGLLFAVAFGNRMEVVVVFPLMLYLLTRNGTPAPSSAGIDWRRIAKFCEVPIALGVAMLLYNQARFGSPFDFGYSRIPGIEGEDWFKHGLFTIKAIPDNAWQMLFETWRRVEGYPYFVPRGFGSSILISSPFLFMILTRDYRNKALKVSAWVAVGLLTLVLWTHANTGGWQFGYRYAMILLPWFGLLLLEGSARSVRPIEIVLFSLSVAISGWGAYLFLWTSYVTP